MDTVIQTLGLVIFASLFFFSGLNHIKSHADMAAYTTATLGKCPVAKTLGFFGGWPTGVFLVIFSVGAAFNEHALFAYGLAAFLAAVTALFHRDFATDPCGFKGVALLGSALYIASQVH